MNDVIIFGVTLKSFYVLPVIYLLWVVLFLIFKKWLFKGIKKFTGKTETKLDDIFIQSANFPLVLLIFTSGGAFVEQFLPAISDAELTKYFVIAFKATTIIAIILFFDGLINGIFKSYANKFDVLRSTGGVTRGIARLLVIGLGLLILLDSFGVSITPILASLGIGSLAVALALQPTLENFFAGVQIIVDKPFKVGQFVKLDTGEEGYVHKIGWRSTWIRLLANNVIVIPNSSIIKTRILNYYYPNKEMSTIIQVGVHYESDLEQVEKIVCEVAKEALLEVEGGVDSFEPFIRYHTFGDFSINFSVILRVHEFVDNYLLKHTFIKMLHKRFAKEGICVPYPIRAINNSQEKAFEKKG